MDSFEIPKNLGFLETLQYHPQLVEYKLKSISKLVLKSSVSKLYA